ncbi:TetR/AcrR family transcriptional regulator [Lonepinella sp. BR2930]|uniref:TetR/AcrR family transcriptional regulator n=1 Tax=Lonepinella sp. BR2930 TaxID=3434554 RepID=UPI003F6E20A0
MIEKKEDRRITRTRELLHRTFLELLSEKEYEDFTVQEIIDRANINRTTFYKHYLNKEALAVQIAEKFKQDVVLPLLQQRFNHPLDEFARLVSPIYEKNQATIATMLKINTRHFNLKQDIQNRFKDKFIEVASKQNHSNKEIDIQLQAAIFSNLGTTILEYLLTTNKQLDPVILVKNIKAGMGIFLNEENNSFK